MPKKVSLSRYNEMRDFTKTAEPKGVSKKQAGHRYFIQKHAATRLHYDLRLELDGVLKSWAVTRGPSFDPNDKRLAVEVEDHPVSYGTFEGTIPKGQYGGGTVMLWDEGTWEPVGDPHEGLKNGKLVFLVHGKRLNGEWTLVRMRTKGEKRNNWLLIKHKDKYAEDGKSENFLEKNITSILSHRKMEEITEDGGRVWQSGRTKTAKTSAKKPLSQTRSKKTGKSSKLPKFQPPQLATLTTTMPQGEQWVHEVKFDGYRALAYINNGEAQMFTRTGLDWTRKFSPLGSKLAKLPISNAIIDGEVVSLDKKGVSSFKFLQKILSEKEDGDLQFYAFDLLHLNGKDLTTQSLLQRKEKLQEIIEQDYSGAVFYSEHFEQGGAAFLKKLCGLHFEGTISKRADAPYKSGRSKVWLKTKCHQRAEFVIGGFTLPKHRSRGLGALLLGYYEKGELRYAGKVGTGFDQATSRDLRKKLDALTLKKMAFECVTADGKRSALWVKPKLVCEIEFTEWTEDCHLRHPSYQGLREDKPPTDVRRDALVPLEDNVSRKTRKRSDKALGKPVKIKTASTSVGGIVITHPDRLIYPGTTITKIQLAEYYFKIAKQILPYVANRPLSMLRCPEGTGEPCFFQRHIARGQSPHLYDTGIKVKGHNETYMMIKDAKGLVTLIQWGVIELHPWGCCADKPLLPDRIIFDLDPDPSLPFKAVIEGAFNIRERMKEFGLKSFVKTTGGKGLHVVIPIEPKYGWPTIKEFAKAIAQSMEHDARSRYISKSSKTGRKGKIFVDYLRNDLTSTAIANFSARARENAPVAVPIGWADLKGTLKPSIFTIETLPLQLRKLEKNPWKGFFETKQKLSERYLKALNLTISRP